MPGDRSYGPGQASHRALRGIRRELDRHPAVETVQGFPSGEHTQVVAQLVPGRLGTDVEEATLTVRWFAGETPEARPEFSFHYSDSRQDLGWHHEPNPHVDDWAHFQQRSTSEPAYTYGSHSFASTNPSRVVWEVMELLTDTVGSE